MARQSYNSRIRARISELEYEIAARQTELDELKIAERVIDRLGSDEFELSGRDAELTVVRGLTIVDLISKILSDHGPKDTSAIHQLMKDEYRRDTTPNTVGSTLSRMKAEGRVTLNGGLWAASRESTRKEAHNEASLGAGGS